MSPVLSGTIMGGVRRHELKLVICRYFIEIAFEDTVRRMAPIAYFRSWPRITVVFQELLTY